MTLPIHAEFSFNTSPLIGDEYLSFKDDVNKIQNFQSNPSSFFHNGMAYEEIQAEDEEDNGVEAEDYEYDFVMWNRAKLLSPHPLTLAEGDPTRGNRLVGCPIAQRRVGTTLECRTEVSHSLLTEVYYQSYSAGTNILTLRLRDPIQTSEIAPGDPFTVAGKGSIESTLTGFGGVQYNIVNNVIEWAGTVADFNGLTLSIQLSQTPPDQLALISASHIAPTNQKIWIVPLGHVRSNLDSYTGVPANYGIVTWTYLNTTTYASSILGPYTTITPSINTEYPAVGDVFKYFIILEKSSSLTDFDNGFKVIPTLIVP